MEGGTHHWMRGNEEIPYDQSDGAIFTEIVVVPFGMLGVTGVSKLG